MNLEDMNKLVDGFIDQIDLRKGRVGLKFSWKTYSKEHLAHLKPKRKNAYLFYVDSNRDRLKFDNPGVPYKDILAMLGSGWTELKKLDNDEYKSYYKMSDDFNTEHAVYEVSKPFHKFSLEFRNSVEGEFPDHTAQQITDVLTNRWKSLSVAERYEWAV